MSIRKLLLGLCLSFVIGGRCDAQQPLSSPIIDDGLGTAQTLRSTYTDGTFYNQATYLTTHNAYSSAQAGWTYAQQTLGFDEQFAYGVWAFMIDLHWCRDSSNNLYLAMAHMPTGSDKNFDYSHPTNHQYLESCWPSRLQRGLKEIPSFESFLSGHAKKWLDNDKEAIVTLHLESYTGASGAKDLHAILQNTNLLQYVYFHASGSAWPTLGDMRKNNKRLIIFSDNLHDTGVDIFHTSEYQETKYNLKESSDCTLRPDNRAASRAKSILLMNHFYSLAYETQDLNFHQINSPYANSQGKHPTKGPRDIATRSEICFAQEGIYPTFVAVDFVEEGDFGGAREQVLRLNKKRLGAVPFSHAIVSPSTIASISSPSFMDHITVQKISTTGWSLLWGSALFKSPYKKALIFSGMAFGVVSLPTFLSFLPVTILPIAVGASSLVLMSLSCKWACGGWIPYDDSIFKYTVHGIPNDNAFAPNAYD